MLAATIEADRRDREERRPEVVVQLRGLEADRRRLEEERARLVDAIAGGSDGAQALGKRLRAIEGGLSQAGERESRIRDELAALDAGDLGPEELATALADLGPVWAELFPAERARVLALLVEGITFDAASGEVEIRFRPGGPQALTEGAE